MSSYPTIPFAAYTEAVTRLDELAASQREASERLTRARGTRPAGVWPDGTPRFLDGELTAAMQADTDAAAEALRLGMPAPKRKAADDVRATIVAADEDLRVAGQALAAQHAEVVRVLREHGDDIGAAMAGVVAQAADSYAAAVDALEAARGAYWEARQVAAWVKAPTVAGDGKVVPPKGTPPPVRNVRGVTTANGDPPRLEPVLDALRAETSEPEPERKPVRYDLETVVDRASNGVVRAVAQIARPVYADDARRGDGGSVRTIDGVPFFDDV